MPKKKSYASKKGVSRMSRSTGGPDKDAYWLIPGEDKKIEVVRMQNNRVLGQYHNALRHVLNGEIEWIDRDGNYRSITDFDGTTLITAGRKADISTIGEKGPRALRNYALRTDLKGFRGYLSDLFERVNRPDISDMVKTMHNDQLYGLVKAMNPEQLRQYLLKKEPNVIVRHPLITDPEKIKELYKDGVLEGRPVEYRNKKRRR